MNTILNRHQRTFCRRSGVLLTLGLLTGCDAFLVSICEFEDRPTCNLMADGSTSKPDTGHGAGDGGGSPASIQERKLDLRATFTIDVNHKFNGIIDKKMLTISRVAGTNYWEAWGSNLNLIDPQKRLFTTGTTGFPSIPGGFNFTNDEIYTSGGAFYYLQHSGTQQLFKLIGSSASPLMNVKLTNSSRPRAFAHPLFNALAVAITPVPSNTNSTLILLDGFSYVLSSNETAPTNYLVGDLDSNDSANNGEEIIVFDGKSPRSVSHWDPTLPSYSEDDNLLLSLKQAIERTASGDESPIEAAFISNLNNDGYPDFIYSRSGQIYITSYLGRDKDLSSRFGNWTTKVVLTPGEKIKSLVAVELTNDMFPELIVETDVAVHFYLNIPK